MCHCSSVNDYDEDGDKDEDGSSAKRMKMIGDDEDDDYLLEVSTYTMYSAYDKERKLSKYVLHKSVNT